MTLSAYSIKKGRFAMLDKLEIRQNRLHTQLEVLEMWRSRPADWVHEHNESELKQAPGEAGSILSLYDAALYSLYHELFYS